MKVPYGYGECEVLMRSKTNPQTFESITFQVDHNSFIDLREVADEWTTLNRHNGKYIYGHHAYFDLKLYDSGTQTDLTKFMYYYNNSVYDDNRFHIYPKRGGGNWSSFVQSLKMKFLVIPTEYPKIENIVTDTRGKGQYLRLRCKTVGLIEKDDYDYIITRNTTSGNWEYNAITTPNYGVPYVAFKIGSIA